MKPRIVIFSTAYLPLNGGAEIAVKEITDRLYNYDFDLITARLDSKLEVSERVGNVQVYRIGIGVPFIDKLLLTFYGAYRAGALHKSTPYQGAWAIMASFGGFAATTFSKRYHVPFMLTLQEGDPLEYIEKKTRWFKGYFRGIFKHAKIVQAISSFLLEWAKQNGYAGKHGVVIPNGVNVARFTHHYSKFDIDLVKEKYSFPKDVKICITVSRLVVKNGVDTSIEALTYLPANVHLVVCGAGPLEAKLKDLAIQKKVADRVHFLGDISNLELPILLHACDMFVRPSRSEGQGIAFIEAMAAGITTIGSNVGGIPDFINNGETGFLTEPNNPTHLARTIEKALAMNVHERHAMHEKALTLIKKNYNWETIATEMDALFSELCKK